MEIFLLLLASFGLTFTIVHAEIMDILKIRPFLNRFEFTRKLIKCSLCSGFYVSLFFAFWYLPLANWLVFAFAGSGFSFIMERLAILIDELVIKLENERKD